MIARDCRPFGLLSSWLRAEIPNSKAAIFAYVCVPNDALRRTIDGEVPKCMQSIVANQQRSSVSGHEPDEGTLVGNLPAPVARNREIASHPSASVIRVRCRRAAIPKQSMIVGIPEIVIR